MVPFDDVIMCACLIAYTAENQSKNIIHIQLVLHSLLEDKICTYKWWNIQRIGYLIAQLRVRASRLVLSHWPLEYMKEILGE